MSDLVTEITLMFDENIDAFGMAFMYTISLQWWLIVIIDWWCTQLYTIPLQLCAMIYKLSLESLNDAQINDLRLMAFNSVWSVCLLMLKYTVAKYFKHLEIQWMLN